MKTIFTIFPTRYVATGFLGLVALVGMYVSAVSTYAATYTPLSAQMSMGDSNDNVRNLQVFLAANTSIYPEGIITGYYGLLTQKAIVRFQNTYGIDPVGRVGPLTLNKLNTLIASGGWTVGTADVSGPWIYSVTQAVTSTSATFTWNTNENATAKVFYYTAPITMNEGDINSVGFGATNGWVSTNDGLSRTSQQVVVGGLQPNTLYYYVIVSTDPTGNVSVWNPNASFRTNQ